ncbi:MAG: 30S ribosomal protein S16 [Victivallaceae bacterium]|nr:30S ribosomal protein S16 [Victivallaceae bacterium]
MVRIRLKRTGTRNVACFRVVVMDQRSSRDGKAIEEIGYYDPLKKEEKLDLERFTYWKNVGAVISETVTDIAERVKNGKSLKDRVRPVKLSKRAQEKARAEAEAKAKAAEEAKAAAEAAKAAEEAAKAEAPADAPAQA